MKQVFIFSISICISLSCLCQDENFRNINLQSSYLLEIPGGDLYDRFGISNKFEFRIEYLMKSNFAFYLKTGLRVGDRVKEDVLSNLRTEDGYVIGVNGFYSDIFGRKRGFDFGIGVDKLLPISKSSENRNHLRFGLAVVKAHHWIRLIDESQSVPQVLDGYAQLYDRYVSGYGIEENINFQFNLKSKKAAFLLGLQYQQVFGKEHRYLINNMDKKKNRLDTYLGIKLSYLMPIYIFDKESTIYY